MKANPETIFSLAGRTATKIASLDPEQDLVQGIIADTDHPYWKAIESILAMKADEKVLQDAHPTVTTVKAISALPTLDDFLTAWPEFCKEFDLAVEVDFESLKGDERITARRSRFDWLVYCPKGLTSRQALELCKKQFKVWKEIDVDSYSLERGLDKTDLVLCRATVEPDKEWLGKTSDYMSSSATLFLDARERYMLEAFYFWLTKCQSGQGKHLDIKGWTRCPRSRSGSRVADADWRGGEFFAGWFYAALPDPDAGGREAVSL